MTTVGNQRPKQPPKEKKSLENFVSYSLKETCRGFTSCRLMGVKFTPPYCVCVCFVFLKLSFLPFME